MFFFSLQLLFTKKITSTSNQEVGLKETRSLVPYVLFWYSLWSFKLAHTAQKQKPLVAHSSLFFLFPEAIKIWNSIFSSFSFTPKTMCIMWCGRVTCRLGLKSRWHFHKTWEQFIIFTGWKPLPELDGNLCPNFSETFPFYLFCWVT